MGYTTYFDGSFNTDKPMNDELVKQINEFAEERHCNGSNGRGYNDHSGFPGFWCNWIASDEYTIEWNEAEKFYEYGEWLKYIIDKFIKPNGLVLNGEVNWQGENSDDLGILIARDNKVYARYGEIVYGEENEITF